VGWLIPTTNRVMAEIELSLNLTYFRENRWEHLTNIASSCQKSWILVKRALAFRLVFFFFNSWGWDEVSARFRHLGNLRRKVYEVLCSECWKFLHFPELYIPAFGIQGSRFHHREIFLTSVVHLFVVYAHFATRILGTLM